jgi:methoxymalonate biosynthesis acyl carrier protein
VREKIRAIIESNLNIFDSDVEFSDDDNIFRKGFVDSLFAVKLLAYLEEEFHIKISNDDLNIDNFYSVNKMISFVESKQQGNSNQGG